MMEVFVFGVEARQEVIIYSTHKNKQEEQRGKERKREGV